MVWNSALNWKLFGYLYDKGFGFHERNEFVNWMDWMVWINWLIFWDFKGIILLLVKMEYFEQRLAICLKNLVSF